MAHAEGLRIRQSGRQPSTSRRHDVGRHACFSRCEKRKPESSADYWLPPEHPERLDDCNAHTVRDTIPVTGGRGSLMTGARDRPFLQQFSCRHGRYTFSLLFKQSMQVFPKPDELSSRWAGHETCVTADAVFFRFFFLAIISCVLICVYACVYVPLACPPSV